MEWVNLRYIVNTYVNITMYPSVQLLYANKKEQLLGRGDRENSNIRG
jgi:hypothetical protein